MKCTFSNFYIQLFLLALTLSCHSAETKKETTEKKTNEAKKYSADSKNDLYEFRLDTISNFEQFKAEAKKNIIAQEKNIIDYKAKHKKEKKTINTEIGRELIMMQEKIKELKSKLDSYPNTGQNEWVFFKNEFNHDMNNQGKAFRDLINKDD